jgi:hypothetical protein
MEVRVVVFGNPCKHDRQNYEATMRFQSLEEFPQTPSPSPYGRQMGASIARLLQLFQGKVPDAESNSRVLELAVTPARWSAAHALYDVVRSRYLATTKTSDGIRSAQYEFEESCLEALYNESTPSEPFDSVSPYWVVPRAVGLARAIGMPVEDVLTAMIPDVW